MPWAVAAVRLLVDVTAPLWAIAGAASINALAVAAVARPEATHFFLDTFSLLLVKNA
ncbi:hypothetical protein [Actinoallomurus rhizosphaericola]|uniref:hypothetical protein n=1 Tax=Actinoallomurus rhizosphaericola TaxID=2952536 RepID=UPI002092ABF6|nr:hypothetical protein [Actinoallomurus rhizosphaericola]MCO5996052.1 hypothetical protein [Actinoallomurus rhizosphaericola]